MTLPVIEIIGSPWCGACKTIRKKLTGLDLPFALHLIPPGPSGWEYVEKRTGSRAIPAAFVDGELMDLKDFVQYIDSLGLPERELTEHELDDIED